MTTLQHKAQTLAAIADTRRVIDQARHEGRVARGEASDWRSDSLERAGELALMGLFAESREAARRARGEV